MKKYDNAITWLKKSKELGNKDYAEFYDLQNRLEMMITPYLTAKQLQALSTVQEGYSYKAEAIVVNLMERLPFEEALQTLNKPEYSQYNARGLLHLSKKEYRNFNFENALKAAQLSRAKGEADNGRMDLIIPFIQQTMELDPAQKAKLHSKVAAGLKNYYWDQAGTLRFIDQSIRKLGAGEDLSALLYLKVVLLRNSNPHSVKEVVMEIVDKYPDSKFGDDALAELVYVQAMVVGELPEAEQTLDRLLSTYPNGNARDNAMNWVAMKYKMCCKRPYRCNDIGDGINACQKAEEYYQRIRQEFPMTRFAGYALQNLQGLTE